MLAYLTRPLLTLFTRTLAYRLYSDNYNIEAVTFYNFIILRSLDTTVTTFVLPHKLDAP